jgi:hypothetical protein
MSSREGVIQYILAVYFLGFTSSVKFQSNNIFFFLCSVSSLASFMSSQETSFVTLGQRVLSKPLK